MDRKIMAVAGIANPESFFKMLEDMGAVIELTERFPDHHEYTQSELTNLIHIAQEKDLIIITTEKDLVKIGRLIKSDMLFFLEVGLDMSEEHVEVLMGKVRSLLSNPQEQFRS